MSPQPPPPRAANEDALRVFEASLHQREELVGLRESMLDAMADFRQADSDQMTLQLQDGRDVNAQLVVSALRLQELTQAAEEANERKDIFLATLSHELRNPLAPMHSMIDMLGQMTDADRRLVWIHEVLERQVGHLTRLIDDLLDAGRLHSGKFVLKKEIVSVADFIGQAVETTSPLFEARHQRFTLDSPADPLVMLGDHARLTQVFVNLLQNASKYTQDGGTIGLNLQRSGNVLVVCVGDNGRGMTEAALSRVFDLFAQEDQSLSHAEGGLGIGLAVVRELVHRHGGSVYATSAGLGRGSEFRVKLPLMDELTASAVAPTLRLAAAPVKEPAAPANSLSIVMIDDNADANDSLAALLSLSGHSVVLAYDGQTGLDLVLAGRAQVVLCDLGLPGLDGLQIATRLSAAAIEPQPLLVALTGYGQGADIARSKAAGFDEHLVKPVELSRLLALLEREATRLAGVPPVAKS